MLRIALEQAAAELELALAGEPGSRTIRCLLRSSGKLFPIYRKPQPRLLIDPLLGSPRFQLAFLCFASVSLCGSL